MEQKTLKWTHPLLTNKLNEIVRSFCGDCLSTKEVADKHCISENTVSGYKKEIFKIFGISKITELSRIYYTSLSIVILFCAIKTNDIDLRSRNSLRSRNIALEVKGSRLRSRRREIPMPLNDLSPNNNIVS